MSSWDDEPTPAVGIPTEEARRAVPLSVQKALVEEGRRMERRRILKEFERAADLLEKMAQTSSDPALQIQAAHLIRLITRRVAKPR